MGRISKIRFGFRRWHHPAPVLPVLLEHPAFLGRDGVRLLFVVDGPDELGGVGERRIRRVDLHHGQHGGERLLEGQEIAQFLLDHVADHALGLGAEDVERVCFHLLVGGRLEGQQPDLRPVAVRDDQLVWLG